MRTHKCRSRLWECAARGQHPNFAVILGAAGKHWVVHPPLQPWGQVIQRADYTLAEAGDKARAGLVAIERVPSQLQEVTC